MSYRDTITPLGMCTIAGSAFYSIAAVLEKVFIFVKDFVSRVPHTKPFVLHTVSVCVVNRLLTKFNNFQA